MRPTHLLYLIMAKDYCIKLHVINKYITINVVKIDSQQKVME